MISKIIAAVYEKPEAIPNITANSVTLERVLSVVYLIAGVVAVIYIIIGGIKYTLSMGDSGKIKQAKDTVLYALIGLIVVILAFSITRYVIGVF